MSKLKKDGTVSKQGEGGGRPPKYTKSDEFEALFTEYVADCTENKKILTKAGWLFKLRISRPTYGLLKKKKKFSYILRQVEFLIEDAWLQKLIATGATGAIFYLKNAFGDDYRDRTETDITSGGKKIQPILGGLSKKKND